jgi:hypothetical protein
MTRALRCLALSLPLCAALFACSSTPKSDPVLVATNDRVVLRKRPPGTYEVKGLLVRQVEPLLDRPWPAADNPAALQGLREAFADAVRADLAPAYPLVNAPGPGVLVVETRLTDRIRDSELLERLPASAQGTAQRAFLELTLTESDTGKKSIAAIWAPQTIAWERMLDARIAHEAKVMALRTLTSALRAGLDRNRAALVR